MDSIISVVDVTKLTEADACAQYDHLVKTTARLLSGKYHRQYGAVCVLDIEQDGRIGLLKAVRKFDPTRGAAFETFAIMCIRQAIWIRKRHMKMCPRRLKQPVREHYNGWRHDDEIVRKF